jgi:hypothetical protein
MKTAIILLSLIGSSALASENFEVKDLNPQSVSAVLEKIKDKVCVMTIRPDTVQVNAGPVVLTWSTERICNE